MPAVGRDIIGPFVGDVAFDLRRRRGRAPQKFFWKFQITPHGAAIAEDNLKQGQTDLQIQLQAGYFFDKQQIYRARQSFLENCFVMKASSLQAAAFLKKISQLRPTLAIVLGSGFHNIPGELRADKKILYTKIPGFPKPTIAGHAGEFYFGHLGETPVAVLSGRAHFYEGYSMERVTFAVCTLAAFGIEDLLLTNAAGGINKNFRVGDFMVLADHINLMGANPLRELPINGLQRFVDLTETYDAKLNRLLFKAGKICELQLRRGVYLAVSGPSYETPAEIRAFAKLGADAVGMSTVPEAIVARQCGLNVAAISCVTNPAAGMGKQKLSHAEVLKTATHAGKAGAQLIKNFAELYGREH